jgi:hypothetical protein
MLDLEIWQVEAEVDLVVLADLDRPPNLLRSIDTSNCLR